MKGFILSLFFLLPLLSFAAQLQNPADFEQEISLSISGTVVRGEPFVLLIYGAADSFTVDWQGLSVKLPADCPDGSCATPLMLPAKYEEHGVFPLTIHANNSSKAVDVVVQDKAYPKEALTVEPKYVALSKADQERAARESKLSSAALKTFSGERLWATPFTRPVPGIVLSEYGFQRVFNGEPRSRHSGLDFRAAAGTEIAAVADGTVILTGNYFFSGQCVYVDHGQGVVSVYMHMSEIIAKLGDKVKAGDTIGLVGATGRVTGPHLHLSVAVQGVSINPLGFIEGSQ